MKASKSGGFGDGGTVIEDVGLEAGLDDGEEPASDGEGVHGGRVMAGAVKRGLDVVEGGGA